MESAGSWISPIYDASYSRRIDRKHPHMERVLDDGSSGYPSLATESIRRYLATLVKLFACRIINCRIPQFPGIMLLKVPRAHVLSKTDVRPNLNIIKPPLYRPGS